MKDKIIKQILDTVKYKPSEHINRLSASEVTASLCELYLRRKHNVEDKVVSQATIGSLLHIGMEIAFADEEYIDTEKAFSKLIPGTNTNATATVDYIDVKNKIVIDWKTTKLYTGKKVKEAIKRNELFTNGYIMQMNHQNYIIDEPGYKFYLGMFYKDAGVDYRTGETTEAFELIEIPMIDIPSYEEYIRSKALDLVEVLKGDVPAKCSDTWPRKIGGVMSDTKCRFYCGVSSVCPHYNSGVVENTEPTW